MNKLLKEKGIFWMLAAVGVLIFGAGFYFGQEVNLGIGGNGPSEEIEECSNIPELEDGALKLVTKVIDGDTFLIEGGYSVRILGITTYETHEDLYTRWVGLARKARLLAKARCCRKVDIQS